MPEQGSLPSLLHHLMIWAVLSSLLAAAAVPDNRPPTDTQRKSQYGVQLHLLTGEVSFMESLAYSSSVKEREHTLSFKLIHFLLSILCLVGPSAPSRAKCIDHYCQSIAAPNGRCLLCCALRVVHYGLVTAQQPPQRAVERCSAAAVAPVTLLARNQPRHSSSSNPCCMQPACWSGCRYA